jgi:hypothetical protein
VHTLLRKSDTAPAKIVRYGLFDLARTRILLEP